MYNFSTSNNTNAARNRLESMIAQGRASAVQALQQVQAEQPKDFLVGAPTLKFDWDDADCVYRMRATKPEGFKMHDHALRQAAQRAGIPWKFVDGLSHMRDDDGGAPWGADLVARNLTEIFGHQKGTRYLTRTVKDQVRGILSDRYRRLDTAPIVEAFVKEVQNYGAVPIQANCLDTKFYLRCVLPGVFEPIDKEFMALGIGLYNSDYGDGAFGLKLFFIRVLCANGMIGDDVFRKIHLGGRLDEDIQFSAATYKADTETILSATKDVVKHALEPANVHARLDVIKAAAAKQINAAEKLEALRKASKLTKEEMRGISESFNSAEVELMPPGNSAWRLSNAISLFAQGADPGRALELEALAGEVAELNAA